MIRRFFAVGGFALVAFVGYALADSQTVRLSGGGPVPSVVTVQWGDAVTWTNGDTEAHQVESPRGGFTSPTISTGATWAQTFTGRAGNNSYRQVGSRKNFGGGVEVDVSGSLTIKATPSVRYGSKLTISGRSSVANSDVSIYERLPDSSTPKLVATVTPDESGVYTAHLKPLVGGRYQATAAAGQVKSEFANSAVLPVVTITAYPRKAKYATKVRVTVHVKPLVAGGTVHLYRFDATRKHWRAASATAGRLVNGKATFTFELPPGRTLLRGWLVNSDLEKGYAPAYSSQIVVTGIGSPPKPVKGSKAARLKAEQQKQQGK
jgi:hypothetical protein